MKRYTFVEAMDLLKKGNLRFSGNKVIHPAQKYSGLKELVKEPNPFATILTCSDSRVVPEFIFDRGIGDLFVIKNAGNIVDQTALGSIEFAVGNLKTPIVLIMGHTHCKAITAAVNGESFEGNIVSVMKELEPIVDNKSSHKTAVKNSIINNVIHAVEKLKRSKPVIAKFVKEKKVQIIGAIYDLKTGKVEFL